MYRTDKQFMKNPATASQRIYIGGLQNTVVADDLEIKFRQHGKILGLVLQRGFAFIQYETDDEARNAIRKEQGAILHGKKIVVKPALPDRNRGGNMMNQQQTPQKPEQNTQPKTPVNQNNQQKPPVNQNNQQKTPVIPGSGNTNYSKPAEEPSKPNNVPPKPPVNQDCSSPNFEEQEMEMLAEKYQDADEQNQDFPPKPQSVISSETFDDDKSNRKKRTPRGGGGVGGGVGRNPRRRDKFREPDQYFGQPNNMYPEYSDYQEYPEYCKPPVMMDRPERNDCEIIVVSKMLTEYAEYIESRLKELGLIVDLLFPNEDVPIGRVLANISSRGCLYAILVMPQNKENQSMTLNVLHGVPQEHRNMPIDDALIFITRNFDAYMRGENFPVGDSESPTTIHDKHPNPMQLLLNMIAENRILTSVQYDKVLKYLEERRELQVKFELSEGIDIGAENSVIKQAELQNRIMNILNKSDSQANSAMDKTPPPPPAPGPTPLLKDPTVQKALDSLLLGDMFKNISSG